ncbi:hypothetical protein JD844_025324 [Phrynosoma platyrhinos]|uniref:Uncharacterized protein n=1 Tax=Phrynosoma platyrhinos TaxID=52577 RepID=A0ABQ7SZN3_PHRPL|nr:hypothetical protein JD844_025324 [Phrynosoma platyrhinos]
MFSFQSPDADRHCEFVGNPLKIKSTRKSLSCIIGYLGLIWLPAILKESPAIHMELKCKPRMISMPLMVKLYKSAQVTLCQALHRYSRGRGKTGSMLLMMVSLLLQKRPGKRKRGEIGAYMNQEHRQLLSQLGDMLTKLKCIAVHTMTLYMTFIV